MGSRRLAHGQRAVEVGLGGGSSVLANSPEADGRRMHDGGDDGAECLLSERQGAQDSAIDPSL